jgi:phytoene dehydrogenase-like protein
VPRYDVAVIGSGLAGLIAAAYLAKHGKKVFMTDPGAEPGGILAAFHENEYCFPALPAITHGFEPRGPYQNLYAHLGIPLREIQRPPYYQVVLPDRRITISPDVQATLDELRREFPREIDNIVRVYREAKEIVESGIRSRLSSYRSRWRSAKAILPSDKITRELMAFFDLQSLFFHGVPALRLTLTSFATMLDSPPVRVAGGYHRLAAVLRDEISRLGGECTFGEAWPELQIRSNRIVALGMRDRVVEPHTVLLNTAMGPTLQNIYLGAREEGVPIGMKDSVLFLSDYDHPRDLGVLAVSSPDDGATAPNGMRSLTVSFINFDRQREKHDVLMERVHAIIPFLKEFCGVQKRTDFLQRRFPLPAHVSVDEAKSEAGIPVKCSIRNMHGLPDGMPSVRMITAAQVLVEKIT